MKKKTEKRRLGSGKIMNPNSGLLGIEILEYPPRTKRNPFPTSKVLFSGSLEKILAMRDELKRLRREVKELRPHDQATCKHKGMFGSDCSRCKPRK